MKVESNWRYWLQERRRKSRLFDSTDVSCIAEVCIIYGVGAVWEKPGNQYVGFSFQWVSAARKIAVGA